MFPLAQAYDPNNFWQVEAGQFSFKIILGLLIGFAFFALCLLSPPQARKYILWVVTFVCGGIYIVQYLLPNPVNRQPDDLPANAIEGVKFWLDDSLTHVGRFSNVLTAFLIGLGTFSLVRLHTIRLKRRQENWQFSAVLLFSFLAIVVFGFWDYKLREDNPSFELMSNWGNNFPLYAWDFMFDGMFQQMEAAMFSVIAFYILSAAYRAFRVRSVESTILLATALILILSQMGAVNYLVSELINNMTNNDPNHFLENFKLSNVSAWIRSFIQSPSLRAINFGIGVGALAMGLRLWLGLERGGGN